VAMIGLHQVRYLYFTGIFGYLLYFTF